MAIVNISWNCRFNTPKKAQHHQFIFEMLVFDGFAIINNCQRNERLTISIFQKNKNNYLPNQNVHGKDKAFNPHYWRHERTDVFHSNAPDRKKIIEIEICIKLTSMLTAKNRPAFDKSSLQFFFIETWEKVLQLTHTHTQILVFMFFWHTRTHKPDADKQFQFQLNSDLNHKLPAGSSI